MATENSETDTDSLYRKIAELEQRLDRQQAAHMRAMFRFHSNMINHLHEELEEAFDFFLRAREAPPRD